MSKVPSHRDLIVWQKAMDLTVLVYGLVKAFPSSEQYALSQQMTRAAVAIPANIAEGKGRGSPREYAQYVSIARGSLMELETYIEIALRVRHVTEAAVRHLLDLTAEIGRMLTSLRQSLLR